RLLLPLLGRMPFSLLYPTGSRQEEIKPRFERWYRWADVIAGDCHYIRRHMPADLTGKVIVTNTTTGADLDAFRQRGVRYVLTTTPQFGGRTFGTNMLEAAITAVAGKGRPLTVAELSGWIRELKLRPVLHDLDAQEM
ncbi:MAG: quinate 5-dehydrogenase, partial [Anaerolineae bacterium]|nr:quinate 5-dehydrogenase [Anaerolineae bacterium]